MTKRTCARTPIGRLKLRSNPTGEKLTAAEESRRAVQETDDLLSIPGMRESIREGLETPLAECDEEPGW
jgi:hypothetical protein